MYISFIHKSKMVRKKVAYLPFFLIVELRYTFFPTKNTVSFSTACASSLFLKVAKRNLRDFLSDINLASMICPYLAKHYQRSSTVA